MPRSAKITLVNSAVIALIGIILFPQDSAGWVVLLVTVGAVCADPELRLRAPVFYCVLVVLFAHHAVAIINAYWFTVTGAETDAYTFHSYAEHRGLSSLTVSIGQDLYRHLLIISYELAGDSLFLGEQLSVFAFTVTLLIFNRLLNLAGVERFRPMIILALGLAPHVLIYTSITLREPWQMLFFVGAVYYGICSRRQFNWLYFSLFLLSAMCLAMLHQVLVPFALLLVIALLIWPKPKVRFSTATGAAVLVIGLVIAFGYASIKLMEQTKVVGSGVLLNVLKGDSEDFLRKIDGYRSAIDKDSPRTGFKRSLDVSSINALVISLPPYYLHYLFAPFVWSITSFADLPIGIVSFFRLGFVFIGLLGVWKVRHSQYYFLFVTLYILACSTWILGTTNYGQASRHHAVSDWLLLLIVGMVLQKWPSRAGGDRNFSASTRRHTGS